VKRDRAIQHLEVLAGACTAMLDQPTGIFPLRVIQLWVFGEVLEGFSEPDRVTVALGIDQPERDVPWCSEPLGARHWADATRMSRNPIAAFWRSTRAPIWNHHIDRPVLLWDDADGIRPQVLAALRAGEGDRMRPDAPSPAKLRQRLVVEQGIALAELRDRTATYGDHRWKPGKLEPYADALFTAADSYLDLTAALDLAG
jgi:hypothetical protein